jgi:hypothetical protein
VRSLIELTSFVEGAGDPSHVKVAVLKFGSTNVPIPVFKEKLEGMDGKQGFDYATLLFQNAVLALAARLGLWYPDADQT